MPLQMDRVSWVAIIVTLATVFLELSSSAFNPVHVFHNGVRRNDDTGRFVNCGPKESEFVLDWTPRVLRPGVTLTLDISMKAIKSFTHGQVCVTIWLKDIPQPIYHDCRDQQCVDAQKVVKKFVPQFRCPLPEGFSVKFTKMPYTVLPTIPLPSGSFRIAANVTNQDNQLLFCVDGEVEINDQ